MSRNMSVGEYAFLGGVVLAALAGLLSNYLVEWAGMIALLLLVLGLIVGFMNVSEKEATPFLVAVIALSLAGQANFGVINTIPGLTTLALGTLVNNILGLIAVFAAPAAVLVALKSVMSIARD